MARISLAYRNVVVACLAIGTCHQFVQAAEKTTPTPTKVSEEEIRRQLADVPEVKLGDIGMPKKEPKKEPGASKWTAAKFQMTHEYLDRRPDLVGLPFRMGDDCKLSHVPANTMRWVSRTLRPEFGEDTTKVATSLRDKFATARAKRSKLPDFEALLTDESATPALMQILTGEQVPLRLLLVELVSGFDGPTASQALAKLAVYDPAPEVRAAALKALAHRPRDEYREMLVSGLRYPWMPVVNNAAEALVTSVMRSSPLEKLADQPDPACRKKGDTHVVRELIRINHLTNCTMCHAPSSGKDHLRGMVPIPGESLPRPAKLYESETGDIFVRADITYLRQDFSKIQAVEDHGKWPKLQRFDFVVRTRAATDEDLRRKPNPAYRETILYALAALNQK